MTINHQEDATGNNFMELNDQELNQVVGGVGSVSGYDYMKMYLQGNILKLYAGYDVTNIQVYRNNSPIRYTRSMTPGQTLDIELFGEGPLMFQVTGHAVKDNVNFEYTLE